MQRPWSTAAVLFGATDLNMVAARPISTSTRAPPSLTCRAARPDRQDIVAVLGPDQAVLPPLFQLLVHALARHADHVAELLLRERDVDAHPARHRLAEHLGR